MAARSQQSRWNLPALKALDSGLDVGLCVAHHDFAVPGEQRVRPHAGDLADALL
jgi:hypothetical protein